LPRDLRGIVVFLCSGLLLVLLVRSAWQADDAYAAWRTVDNFINGYGLRYNIDVRVQSFTSMLWTFLIALIYSFVGNIYYSSIFTSLLLSIATALIVVWPFRHNFATVLFANTALCMSVSFTDFSAAGFENPLSHFILAITGYLFLQTDLNRREIICCFSCLPH
jgi:arabinofuranosyltransferase